MHKIKDDYIVLKRGFDHLDEVQKLNRLVFHEKRLLNRLDHHPMIFLTAHFQGQIAGFKIGYPISERIFYSAKGATAPLFRRMGIARSLLFAMMADARKLGYQKLHYDTFPNCYPGMTVLGLKNGFHIKHLQWNKEHEDFQVRMECKLI